MIHTDPHGCLYDETHGVWVQIHADCTFGHHSPGETTQTTSDPVLFRSKVFYSKENWELAMRDAVELEREACAVLADHAASTWDPARDLKTHHECFRIASMIRSRGDK